MVRWIAAAIASSFRRRAAVLQVVGDEQAASSLEALFRAETPFAPVVYYWQRDVISLFLLGTSNSRLGALLRELEYVCDDSFGGRVTAELLRRLGGRPRCVHRGWSTERLRELHRMLRSSTPIGIAIDGHGPYGVVRDEVGRLLSGARAVAVPVAVAASRSVPLHLRAVMLLPRRDARIAVTVGERVDVARVRDDAAAQMDGALRRAAEAARFQIGVSVMRRAVPRPA